MKSLSNNLLKRSCTCLQQEEKRVINTNELMEKRIRELAGKMNLPENDGFVSGLKTETVDMLLQDAPEDDAVRSNVIKANAGEEAANFREQAKKEAAALLEQAQAEAEALRQETYARLEAEKAQALEQAREEGYQAGMAAARAENSRLEETWRQKQRELEADYQRLTDELEPRFVDVITGVYEHIFHVELHAYREVLTYLISSTMRKIEGGRNFLIHVSGEDYPYVSMQKKQIMAGVTAANSTVEVIEDLTLEKNQCLIETENGIFDCGVGTQLFELQQKLKLLSYEK